jgi:hypothetical protein
LYLPCVWPSPLRLRSCSSSSPDLNGARREPIALHAPACRARMQLLSVGRRAFKHLCRYPPIRSETHRVLWHRCLALRRRGAKKRELLLSLSARGSWPAVWVAVGLGSAVVHWPPAPKFLELPSHVVVGRPCAHVVCTSYVMRAGIAIMPFAVAGLETR